MTKRFFIREEVTDCNVGDVLKTEDGVEVICTTKDPNFHRYRVGDVWYDIDSLPKTFFTTKEVYPECSEYGTYYKEK